MNISIINEVLVLLDDHEKLSLNEINKILKNRTLQTISSALGRLNSKGWVKSSGFKNNKDFSITQDGKDEITNNLSRIREFENKTWNNKLYVLTFKIPEKIRKSRDILRKKLNELGYSNLMGDLWINFWDKSKYIQKILKEQNIADKCLLFCINDISKKDMDNIIKNLTWNKEYLDLEYNKFIKNCEKYLKKPVKGYMAKLLVYSYSKILAYDPIFPDKYYPDDYIADEAYQYYSKIRPYCYN